jgi:3',5'-cyclic AMP phosphodiesterase CpdA
LSDLHFGRHDELAAKLLVADLSRARPDVVVVTGDLTQRARHRQFAAARAFLERLPRPVIVIPGNHDVPLYDVVERFVGRLARYRRYICAELQPFFADDEIALLGLNTARSAAFSNGRISYRQAAAIKSVFAEVPTNRLRILAIHHPLAVPVAAGDLRPVGRAAMARKALTEAGVRLVLSGHYHHAFSGDLPGGDLVSDRSILFVQAGTAISTRLRGEPNSYNLLHLEPNAVTCTVRSFGGKDFEDSETARYALIGERWSLDRHGRTCMGLLMPRGAPPLGFGPPAEPHV